MPLCAISGAAPCPQPWGGGLRLHQVPGSEWGLIPGLCPCTGLLALRGCAGGKAAPRPGEPQPALRQRDAKSHRARCANRMNYACYSEVSPEISLARCNAALLMDPGAEANPEPAGPCLPSGVVGPSSGGPALHPLQPLLQRAGAAMGHHRIPRPWPADLLGLPPASLLLPSAA